jgi:hypothetical protein
MAGEAIPYVIAAFQAMAPVMDWIKTKIDEVQAFLLQNRDGVLLLGQVYFWLQNTIWSALQLIYATIKFVLGSAIDFVAIQLKNMVEIGFWVYENWGTVWRNIPNLVFASLKAIGSGIGQFWENIKNGDFLSFDKVFEASKAELNKNLVNMKMTQLNLENPWAKIGENAKQYADDVSNINTSAYSDTVKRAQDAFAENKKTNAAEAADLVNGRSTAEDDILDKDKNTKKKMKQNSKDEFADLVEVGSEKAYQAMLAAYQAVTGGDSANNATGSGQTATGTTTAGLPVPMAPAAARQATTTTSATGVDPVVSLLSKIAD